MSKLHPDQIYRLITDYEALQDGFADRIEDLNVPLTEVDVAGELTRGNTQKLLVKSDAPWARQFGWESLGKMLKGTGLALALIIDDERFAPIKAEMQQRRMRPRKQDAKQPSKALLQQFKMGIIRANGSLGGKRRMVTLSKRQRTQIAKAGAAARWSKRTQR